MLKLDLCKLAIKLKFFCFVNACTSGSEIEINKYKRF